MVALPVALLAIGALVALIAAQRGSFAVLVVAGVLLLFAIMSTALRARRHLVLRRHQFAAVVFVIAASAAVLVPASGATDRCARVDRGDDLSGCDLSGRDLTAEDLRGADLRDADLSGTDLAGADLSGADLRNADLSRANLTDVRAPEANFEGADFTRTTLQRNDFSGTLGVTGDDFVAAFSVPRTQLAGETARRGVALHDYDEIVEAIAPVHYGQPVPEVQPYELNRAFHPAIVIDTTRVPGLPSWADAVRDQWAPTAIRYAELVVVVTGGREALEVCGGYVDAATGAPAAPITRVIATASVKVVSAHDARVIGERTFRGSEPRPCSDNEDNTITEVVGNPPDVGTQARPWLESLINPPERIA
jgi:pentapeptide repeat protein